MNTDSGCTDRLYPRATISVLPDDVLLEIFNVYVDKAHHEDAWHTLVHVCRRWRCIVFSSPVRLNLQLLCTNRRPVEKTLDIWPALPIVISTRTETSQLWHVTNIIAALEQHNRVYRIDLQRVPNSSLKTFAVIMEKPFPALTSLVLHTNDENPATLPDSFLGGSASHLRELYLIRIPFPALPRLQSFYLGFRPPRSQADRALASRRPPPLTRIVLPALTKFWFKGNSEYLEDFVSRINAPLLDNI